MFKSFNPIALVRVAMLITVACASSASMAQAARQMVTQVIDERQTVELMGNARPEGNTANDRGPVDDALVLDHLQILLKRPPERETALVNLIDQLHNPKSPSFHQWLSAEQFRTDYGPADADVNAISDWLSKHGMKVHGVQSNGMVIDFSGTAAQIRDAFHTEIHRLDVNGVTHIANMSNPQIPAALADAVSGLVSLNDFHPHANYKARPQYTYVSGQTTYHPVVPADLATIYNLNPLFNAGISGQGQTIVVIENTDVYNAADWTNFRSTFGLSTYTSGSLTQVHPAPASGTDNCSDPGVVAGNELEATLDAQWASAAAPSAAIVVASCKDTATTFGGLIALQNLVNSSNPPAIISMSYGECEAENGAAANAAYSAVYQQAVTRGVSVFVSTGDEGAASCDADQSNATHGIGVSGLASTPYNVAVGGTDFADTYAGDTASYWHATNATNYGSVMSYVPEIPWNDSCASAMITKVKDYSASYGRSGFCNSSAGKADYLTTVSGSGGPSGCATGVAKKSGVVSGTCKGYPKPSWQSVVGNPADGVRDLPDVSLFAANGVWGHYYLLCDSDVSDGGAACTGAPSTWTGAGGTSFASPIWAGFQALVNQKTQARQGNPNAVYYALAAAEYGKSGNSSCNSSLGNGVASSCIFYNITLGDMDVNCTGTNSCYAPSGTYGVLSTSDSAYSKAYSAGTGWSFATGIGTVNVSNLVEHW
jgi:subtilase family serine protease